MSVAVTIDLVDPTPPFEQVRRQLTLLIETGQLVTDERLPSVRQLAGDLGLATGTVARAYKELEGSGLVTTRRGAGTRVASRPESASPAAVTLLEDAATSYLARAAVLGATPEQAALALERVTRRR
ncbi:GntR family transcriptional regulator [Janibacter sp. Soil728]|uniref:GntR family transcriptional regulator n=1 Tax=Janibacter sp. Soil728 TaxID=1736393 RepID=UPI0006FBB80B|nr:GntR family transcriptional regulator [Janibacter sp. Soil728]KRE36066.1 GntR family transcriptional regulator [Janibacter sp. Soil728]